MEVDHFIVDIQLVYDMSKEINRGLEARGKTANSIINIIKDDNTLIVFYKK